MQVELRLHLLSRDVIGELGSLVKFLTQEKKKKRKKDDLFG